MDDAQFAQWATMLERRAGMSVPRTRRRFLITNIGLRMREIGCTDYQSYYNYLCAGRQGMLEWTVLVDRLTVQETQFFRHPPSFQFIHGQALPGLVLDKISRASIQTWSVGCASGEEAYSLAMVIDNYLQALVGHSEPYYGVTASDISLTALTLGRRGIYTTRQLRAVPAQFRSRYFVPVEEDRFQIISRLRKRTCFVQTNVLELAKANLQMMDLIFCQNLLIYFNRERRITILNELAGFLRPGGILILGSGEAIGWTHPRMQPIRFGQAQAFCCTRE